MRGLPPPSLMSRQSVSSNFVSQRLDAKPEVSDCPVRAEHRVCSLEIAMPLPSWAGGPELRLDEPPLPRDNRTLS